MKESKKRSPRGKGESKLPGSKLRRSRLSNGRERRRRGRLNRLSNSKMDSKEMTNTTILAQLNKLKRSIGGELTKKMTSMRVEPMKKIKKLLPSQPLRT